MKISGCLILSVILLTALSISAQKLERFIAVTIDDLPVVSTRTDIRTRQQITTNLLKHFTKAKIPVIGFVNENKLYTNGQRDEAQIDLLRKWIGLNFELGNHTFSHMSLHDNSLENYEADILKGEIVTKELMQAKGKQIRYFRHPFLWTGLSLETKKNLGDFLTAHGYTIAPVTIDNSDYIFARAYDNAFDKKDKNLMRQIGAAYVPYLNSKMDYWERQSSKVFSREIKQILLLHANTINSVYFGDIVRMLKKRGYKFVTLDDALTDEAYKIPDTFVKRNGISWLHRWAIAKGRENILPDEPKTPDFVLKESGFDSE